MNFGEEGILRNLKVNGHSALLDLDKFPFSVSPGTLFPELYSHAKVEKPSGQPRVFFYGLAEETPYQKEAHRLIKAQIDKRISEKAVNHFVERLFSKPFLTSDRLRYISTGLSAKFRTVAREMAGTSRQDLTEKVSHLIIAAFLPTIMSSISDHLKAIFSSTLYIGPARARSERYYRYQDLSVSEIDPDGKNFPMFLNSLSNDQMESLSSWIQELFGYGIQVKEESGHISIQLMEHGSRPNITDVGYGVSQILPVLGQI
ncbi:hypothetical protein [Methylorubrum aminovorans]|uniref:hypothetical protein n=1 Tax=Methylorubrum aminovorans TaxID=269069 RepID=UPI003C2D32A5